VKVAPSLQETRVGRESDSLAGRLVTALLQQTTDNWDDIAEHVSIHIADTVAIAVAAQDAEPVRIAIRSGARGSGGGGCGSLAGAQPLPPAQAAFASAAAAHALDFDDVHDQARLHPTTVALAAALTAAQLSGADGLTLARAVAAGSEVMCRLGAQLAPTSDNAAGHWFTTQLLGYVGGALAAGIALGLDPAALVEAIGLSTMQAAGAKQVATGVGSTARGIYPAFAAAGGVSAALLAAEGLRGPHQALEGRDGLFASYLCGADFDFDTLAAPDADWAYAGTDIKPWPCCRISHPYVSAALAARRKLRADGAASGEKTIEHVVLDVNASAAKLCFPVEQRRTPATLADAKYSVPFMTAVALVHERVDLETAGEACLTDQAVLALAQLIEVRETLPDATGHPPAQLTLHLNSGLRVTTTAAPELSLGSGAGLHQKVSECLRNSPESAVGAADLIAAVGQLCAGSAPGAADRLLGLSSGHDGTETGKVRDERRS
jgi:2-methylcitrate dehydratase PrpD